MIRAGQHGEYEQKFINDKCFYITWNGLDCNLAQFATRDDLKEMLKEKNPDEKSNTIRNWSSQLWIASHEIKKGDWIVLPLKSQSVIYIGEVTLEYQFDQTAQNPYYHKISVKWIGENIPRQNFSQDLLYSFGAFLTICRISRNDAEERLKNMKSPSDKQTLRCL